MGADPFYGIRDTSWKQPRQDECFLHAQVDFRNKAADDDATNRMRVMEGVNIRCCHMWEGERRRTGVDPLWALCTWKKSFLHVGILTF